MSKGRRVLVRVHNAFRYWCSHAASGGRAARHLSPFATKAGLPERWGRSGEHPDGEQYPADDRDVRRRLLIRPFQ